MTADTRDFESWLVKQSVVMGVSLGEVLREEAPQTALALARATPPLAGRNLFSQPWSAQKKAGENAVRGDIAKIYITSNSLFKQIASQDEDAAKAFRRAVTQENRDEVKRLLGAFGLGEFAHLPIGQFSASYHESARMPRYGRPSRNQRLKQMVKSAAPLNRYVKEKVARVGHLKRGWIGSVRGLPKQPRWPAWLMNGGRKEGSLSDKSRRRNDPYIRLQNLVSYSGRRNSTDRFVFHALVFREKTIERKVRGMAWRKWRRKL